MIDKYEKFPKIFFYDLGLYSKFIDFSGNFFFKKRPLRSNTRKFPKKIFVTVLSPLYERLKTTYLRGDTCGGGVWVLLHGGILGGSF
jgi:hypothetical protein